MRKGLLSIILSLVSLCLSFAQQLAFPTAEGFGKYASGGRGGTVYHVINLNDTGVGSFRDAVSQPNRIVVFDVGGVIQLKSTVRVRSNITIAGQTAPGDGICLYGAGLAFGGSSNIIVRYIRVRAGLIAPSGTDAMGVSSGKRMIFDHVSVSWGRDGTFDMNRVAGTVLDSITLQNMIISHGLQPHSTGGLMFTDGHMSVINTLFANNWTRNPKTHANMEFVNNVLYHWGASSINLGGGTHDASINIINNYMISGPSTNTRPGIMGGDSSVYAYISGNFWDKNRNGVLDGDSWDKSDAFYFPVAKNNYPKTNILSAKEAYAYVLKNAGASLYRDQIDSIVIADLASLGKAGKHITNETELLTNGVGSIRSGTNLLDTDKDGMPDDWELKFGLNPQVQDHNGDNNKDGYTNLENYLNCLVGEGNCTPPACLASITYTGETVLCEGDKIILKANSAKTYSWYKDSNLIGTSQSYTATSTGNYRVETITSAGCKAISSTISIKVNPLPILTHNTRSDTRAWTQNTSLTFCEGKNVITGPLPNVSTGWTWKGPNGFTSTSRNPVISNISSAQAGKYTANYTDGNGCANSLDLTLVVSIPTATITSPKNSFCSGSNVILAANSGNSYKWFKGGTQVGTSQTITVTSASDYSVQVSNNNGCFATSIIKTITENTLPVLTHNTRTDSRAWTQNTTLTLCEGENIITGPWPNVSTGWSWTGPNGFTSTVRNPNINAITPSQSGKYTANYTNANGCSNSLDLILEIKSIESVTYNYQINGGTWKTGTNSTMCEGDDIQFAAWPVSGSSWSWSGPSGFTSSLRNPLLSNISTNQFGVYSTTQTDGNSCKSSASFTINKCMVTALEGTIENKIVVFPNPNTGNFTLAMEDEFEHHVMIIDLRGNEMYHASFVGSLNINSDLPSGFYLLRIDENFLTQKLIVD